MFPAYFAEDFTGRTGAAGGQILKLLPDRFEDVRPRGDVEPALVNLGFLRHGPDVFLHDSYS